MVIRILSIDFTSEISFHFVKTVKKLEFEQSFKKNTDTGYVAYSM